MKEDKQNPQTYRTPAPRSSNSVNHWYDYRPNWTPLSPITIIHLHNFSEESDDITGHCKRDPNFLRQRRITTVWDRSAVRGELKGWVTALTNVV